MGIVANAPPLTTEDFRAMPEGTLCQLIEGDLIMSPAPKVSHQQVILNLALLIGPHLERHRGLGRLLIAPVDVYLTDTNAYQPDVIFVAEASRSLVRDDGIYGGPELVIEVLSPSSEKYDRGAKRRIYSRCGVVEYWIADLAVRRLEVYRFRESVEVPVATHLEGDALETPLLPGLRVKIAAVFARG